jgi:methionyl aminopeptidase
MSGLRLGQQTSRAEFYRAFSDDEFERRQQRVRDAMADEDLDAIIAYNWGGFHQAVIPYLTNYRPPFPTYLAAFVDPDEADTLFVGVSNHVQFVREAAVVEELRLMLPDPPRTVVDRLEEAEAIDRVGVVGDDPRYNFSLPHEHHRRFETDLDAELVDVTPQFIELLSVTTPTERDRVTRAAFALDSAMHALQEAIEPGVSEQALAGVLADACRENGGSLDLAFISSAPMADAEPGAVLPWKLPSPRTLDRGDVVTTEISASVDGYATQIHRPFAVGTDPSDQYQALFDVAETAYHEIIEALQPGNTARDVADSMGAIESSEFKIYDVLVHGYGSAYRHPFIGVPESNYWPGADDGLTAGWTFEPGMVIVVQPNVVTRDERAGLQFGTTVLIGDDGPEVIQDYPLEFGRT